MSITAAELIFYGCASEPEDDVSLTGGAIDTTTTVVPTSASLFNATGGSFLDYVSANAGDAMNITVIGRNAAGSIVSETKALNGTTVVNGAVAFTSIEKIVLASAAAGTVTVTKHSGGATVSTIAVGVKTVRRMFYGAKADAASGGTETYYEKLFLKNTDGTLSLLSAQISETSDASNVMDFGLAAAVNDSATVANRKAAPAGISFASTAQNVPGTDLAAGAAIGIWARLTLPAGQAASEYSWGLQASGNTT